MPPFLRTTVGIIVAIVLAIGAGAGSVFAWKFFRDRSARQEIKAKPVIAENQKAIDSVTPIAVKARTEYLTSSAGFRKAAAAATSNPSTTPAVRACFDSGLAVISKCDSMHKADTTLIALYRQRAELMEEEAIRAKRGKLFDLTLAAGYEPLLGAPAGRAGLSVNVADHWSVVGTYDQAAKFRKDSTGRLKTDLRPSSFVGLQYHFGGRR